MHADLFMLGEPGRRTLSSSQMLTLDVRVNPKPYGEIGCTKMTGSRKEVRAAPRIKVVKANLKR